MMSAVLLDDAQLQRWALPQPERDGDKDERGRVLLVAGSRQTPGAALLAGNAALRAGAGKLLIATVAPVAAGIALAIPEARVIALPETPDGGLSIDALSELESLADSVDAALIGPGMSDEAATAALVERLLPRLRHSGVILDALAIQAAQRIGRFEQPVLLTPHAGEMARLTGAARHAIEADPLGAASGAAARWNAVVALKGADTFIAMPHGHVWRHRGGNAGLATSGSGDVLAGLIAGLAARGASLPQACAWGVALHSRAADRLAQRVGPLGFLMRELAGEIPALMHELSLQAPRLQTDASADRAATASEASTMANKGGQQPKKADQGGQRSSKPEKPEKPEDVPAQPGAKGTTGTASQPIGGDAKAQPQGRATRSGM